jgi:hypothetical protein
LVWVLLVNDFCLVKPLRCDFCDKGVPVSGAGVNQLFGHYEKSEVSFLTKTVNSKVLNLLNYQGFQKLSSYFINTLIFSVF